MVMRSSPTVAGLVCMICLEACYDRWLCCVLLFQLCMSLAALLVSGLLTRGGVQSARKSKRVGAATPSGSRTIGERVRGRKSNGCASETFLFWRAAGEENFALEAANKQFSLDFQVGSTFWVEAWNPLP